MSYDESYLKYFQTVHNENVIRIQKMQKISLNMKIS